MKHGQASFYGGGAHVVAFTRSTDGAGEPSAASSTTHFGSPAAAITLTRTGAGVYRCVWDRGTYGTLLASAHFGAAIGAGDFTTRLAIDRANGIVDVTFLSGGVATDIVSGALICTLIFGPMGY